MAQNSTDERDVASQLQSENFHDQSAKKFLQICQQPSFSVGLFKFFPVSHLKLHANSAP